MTHPPHATAAPGAVVEEIAALGPFFAVTTHPAGAPPGEPWQPMAGALPAERAAAVQAYLAAAGGQPAAAVELRVAASVAHLGLAARLVSPALAAAVLHGRPFGYHLGAVRWQPALGGPVPLSLPDDALHPRAATPEQLADAVARRLLAGPLAELADHFRPLGVSPHILLGNTASAVNGAATALAAARPELAAPAHAFAAQLLQRPPLRPQGARTPTGAFRRRSCCLIYRAAPDRRGALCGDCALRAPTA
ncbi:(2Fe-2S)-binding protein [Streptomyces cocklensis]|uniref:Ferric iron reductase FhuF-like transporter n=1 Tax=Actinacidiphila cocklensis TaxID=887465 RepID=A0A9W4E0P4_9ACTN|nr:(2Fe-2S)-binding protein [Actinacidiphila cocklensis]MDD1059693.1 (2Fe-2S)-binding protein [Actinacidiphila cocklensis]CAG6396962.1 Ferric iron reductase FhuF-like transporter [Actinacidiphila cocklensis]